MSDYGFNILIFIGIALVIAGFGVVALLPLSQKIRQWLWILGTMVLIFPFIVTIAAVIAGTTDTESLKKVGGIFPIALTIAGLSQLLFASDAAELIKQQRAKGWNWGLMMILRTTPRYYILVGLIILAGAITFVFAYMTSIP